MEKKLSVRLRCSSKGCGHPCTKEFDAEVKIRDALLTATCPKCGQRGSLRMQSSTEGLMIERSLARSASVERKISDLRLACLDLEPSFTMKISSASGDAAIVAVWNDGKAGVGQKIGTRYPDDVEVEVLERALYWLKSRRQAAPASSPRSEVMPPDQEGDEFLIAARTGRRAGDVN